MILPLLAAPFVAALGVWLVRYLRSVAATIAALAALTVAFLALYGIDTAPFIVLGRTLALDAATRVHLAVPMVLLAITMASSARLPERDTAWPLAFAGIGLIILSLAIQNILLGTLILQSGLVVLAMLIPLRSDDPTPINLRALLILVMAGILLSAAAWLIEHPAAGTEAIPEYMGPVALIAGYGVILGAFPFFVWKLPIYRTESSIARTMFGVVLPHLLLVRIIGLQMGELAPAGDMLAIILLNVGIATFIVGCIGALVQRSVSGLLGYMAISELGVVLMGLGSDTMATRALGMTHLIQRGMAIVAMSMGVAILRHSFASDHLSDLRGAFRRAPLASLGILLAGFSLAGLPPLAGFVTRFALYRIIAIENLQWAIALAVIGLAPAWAMVRLAITAFQVTPVPGSQQEPVWPGAWVLVMGLVTLAWGLVPQALAHLPANWASLLYGLTGFGN